VADQAHGCFFTPAETTAIAALLTAISEPAHLAPEGAAANRSAMPGVQVEEDRSRPDRRLHSSGKPDLHPCLCAFPAFVRLRVFCRMKDRRGKGVPDPFAKTTSRL
jgi:hypothetical protein